MGFLARMRKDLEFGKGIMKGRRQRPFAEEINLIREKDLRRYLVEIVEVRASHFFAVARAASIAALYFITRHVMTENLMVFFDKFVDVRGGQKPKGVAKRSVVNQKSGRYQIKRHHSCLCKNRIRTRRIGDRFLFRGACRCPLRSCFPFERYAYCLFLVSSL